MSTVWEKNMNEDHHCLRKEDNKHHCVNHNLHCCRPNWFALWLEWTAGSTVSMAKHTTITSCSPSLYSTAKSWNQTDEKTTTIRSSSSQYQIALIKRQIKSEHCQSANGKGGVYCPLLGKKTKSRITDDRQQSLRCLFHHLGFVTFSTSEKQIVNYAHS